MSDSKASSVTSPLGIVAGNGSLPFQIIKEAKDRGMTVVAVAHRGETDLSIERLADFVVWVRVGQLGKVIKTFKKHAVQNVVFAGGIRRVRLFGGVWVDRRGLRLLRRLGSVRDDVLLRGIAEEFESEGIVVLSAASVLQRCLPDRGVLTSRLMSLAEHQDAALAWEAAKASGALDIGQGAVAFEGIVIAVEAVEGTDEMIARAGSLAGTSGTAKGAVGPVLVKVAKPQQDLRLDLPTVGIDTLDKLHAAGFSGLVLEEQKALILDPARFVAHANSLQLAVEIHNSASIMQYKDTTQAAFND